MSSETCGFLPNSEEGPANPSGPPLTSPASTSPSIMSSSPPETSRGQHSHSHERGLYQQQSSAYGYQQPHVHPAVGQQHQQQKANTAWSGAATDPFRSLDEVERDFAFLENSSAAHSSSTLPQIPNTRGSEFGWGHLRLSSGSVPSFRHSAALASFPATPVKLENPSPPQRSYYPSLPPQPMLGEERYTQLLGGPPAMHHQHHHHHQQHWMRHDLSTHNYQLPHGGLHYQSQPTTSSCPAQSVVHPAPHVHPAPSHAAWDLASHDGYATSVASYPPFTYPATEAPTAGSIGSSMPSFSSSDLSSFSDKLKSSSEASPTITTGQVKDEQKPAEKDSTDEDDDEDEDEEEQEDEPRSEKRPKKINDTAEGGSGPVGLRPRKRSSAGDLAAAKKKKVALERERRKELTNFFYRLQSCVPSLRSAPTRPTKAILLQSACDYIQTLESEIAQLRSENQRLRDRDSPFEEARGPSTLANVYTRRQGAGNDATRLLFVTPPTAISPSASFVSSSSSLPPRGSLTWGSHPHPHPHRLPHLEEYSVVAGTAPPTVPTTLSTTNSPPAPQPVLPSDQSAISSPTTSTSFSPCRTSPRRV